MYKLYHVCWHGLGRGPSCGAVTNATAAATFFADTITTVAYMSFCGRPIEYAYRSTAERASSSVTTPERRFSTAITICGSAANSVITLCQTVQWRTHV